MEYEIKEALFNILYLSIKCGAVKVSVLLSHLNSSKNSSSDNKGGVGKDYKICNNEIHFESIQ